uniref:Carbonyl reductase n=1 Tax=Panagrolaimus sp. JU765 TaxID=591449 RepID=A0AC34Q4H9_9BILA
MSEKVFVVTGANKGIGYGIVENLAQNVNNGIIYLTARNVELGENAVKKLTTELGSKQKSKIAFHQLEITDENSVKKLAEYLKKTHGAEVTNNINYYGTKLVSNHLIPLIREGGRVVNVCSQGGVMNTKTREPNYEEFMSQLTDQTEIEVYKGMYDKFMKDKYSQSNIDRLVNAKSEADIDAFVEDYKKSVQNGNPVEAGFPTEAYRVSKAAEIALSLLHHRMYGNKIRINACCPGYVNTDMTQGRGHLTIEQGADTPSYLATDPDAPSGQFVYLRKIIDWH